MSDHPARAPGELREGDIVRESTAAKLVGVVVCVFATTGRVRVDWGFSGGEHPLSHLVLVTRVDDRLDRDAS